jgi:hypothetical protein
MIQLKEQAKQTQKEEQKIEGDAAMCGSSLQNLPMNEGAFPHGAFGSTGQQSMQKESSVLSQVTNSFVSTQAEGKGMDMGSEMIGGGVTSN